MIRKEQKIRNKINRISNLVKKLGEYPKDIDFKKPGAMTLLKKRVVEKYNKEFIPFGLDPKKFFAKKKCKSCHGTGKEGYFQGTPIMCKCVQMTDDYKKELKEIREKEKSKDVPKEVVKKLPRPSTSTKTKLTKNNVSKKTVRVQKGKTKS